MTWYEVQNMPNKVYETILTILQWEAKERRKAKLQMEIEKAQALRGLRK